jgi:hypothetical protein
MGEVAAQDRRGVGEAGAAAGQERVAVVVAGTVDRPGVLADSEKSLLTDI